MAFAGNAGLKATRTDDMVLLSGIEYENFKLFALSILWRASVSSLSMFEQVNLGPHENSIRTMILKGDAGRQHRYPILLTQIVHENRMQEDLIVAPTWAKCAGHKAYRFVFYGLAWIFLVSSHRAPRFIDEAALSEQGTARLLISEIRDMPFLRDYLVRVFNRAEANGAAR